MCFYFDVNACYRYWLILHRKSDKLDRFMQVALSMFIVCWLGRLCEFPELSVPFMLICFQLENRNVYFEVLSLKAFAELRKCKANKLLRIISYTKKGLGILFRKNLDQILLSFSIKIVLTIPDWWSSEVFFMVLKQNGLEIHPQVYYHRVITKLG